VSVVAGAALTGISVFIAISTGLLFDLPDTAMALGAGAGDGFVLVKELATLIGAGGAGGCVCATVFVACFGAGSMLASALDKLAVFSIGALPDATAGFTD